MTALIDAHNDLLASHLLEALFPCAQTPDYIRNIAELRSPAFSRIRAQILRGELTQSQIRAALLYAHFHAI